MDKETFVREQLKVRGIPEVTSKYKKSIVNLILQGYREADITSVTAMRITKKYFPDKPKGEHIFNYLVRLDNKAACSKCKQVLEKTYFYTNVASKTKISNQCKSCMSEYKSNNRGLYNFLESKRYTAKLERTPLWADLGKIKEIYNNCPEGYHVDHILPLRGKTISGLHVENNLQYLPAKENVVKHNKFNSYSEDLR